MLCSILNVSYNTIIKQVLTRIMAIQFKLLLLTVNCRKFNNTKWLESSVSSVLHFSSRILRAGEEILPLGNVISIAMINYEPRLHESLTARRRILGRENDELCASISFDRSGTTAPTAVILELAAGSDSY